ncbi:MAG: V-type ATPase 116kDa subunit family protein [Campylobacterota bacterium]|nr:V-type ATPase 116kDa subunit family protein [Campylobacterota bacterium]
MLFPEKMLRTKIEIEAKYSDIVLEAIGKEGVLHIDKTRPLLKNEAEASRVNTLLTLVQKYMKLLEVKPKKQAAAFVSNIDSQLNEMENTLLLFGTKIDDISLQLKESDREREHFDQAFAVKAALAPVVAIDNLSESLKHIRMHIGIMTMEATELLRLSMKQKELLQVDRPLFEQTSAVVVFFEEEDESEVIKAFNTVKAIEIPADYFSEQANKLQKITGKQLSRDFQTLVDNYGEQLQHIESRLRDLQALEAAKSALSESDRGVMLEGWIPEKAAKKFAAGLDHASVTFLAMEGEAPVLLKTPPALKPFEKLISSFSYPRYGEVNPVMPFAFSFLLLFGIMFGDVGHGLVLALLGWLVKKQSTDYTDLGQIYYLSGLSSTLFGFLYGSVFGVHNLLPSLLFTPIENIQATIIFSIGIGIGIITLSFFLHMITAVKRKEPSLLFISEGSVLWLLVYWFTIGIFIKSIVQNLDITYELMILSLLLLVIFVQMLRKTAEKTQAVIDLFREFMDTITNTLSFLRVGAFALAHGALFMAVFSIARMISETYGESFFYWILIIVGNVVIIVLEGVIVTIQTLRLEYYEFFKRFFKGGGTPYRPYRLGGKNEN